MDGKYFYAFLGCSNVIFITYYLLFLGNEQIKLYKSKKKFITALFDISTSIVEVNDYARYINLDSNYGGTNDPMVKWNAECPLNYGIVAFWDDAEGYDDIDLMKCCKIRSMYFFIFLCVLKVLHFKKC